MDPTKERLPPPADYDAFRASVAYGMRATQARTLADYALSLEVAGSVLADRASRLTLALWERLSEKPPPAEGRQFWEWHFGAQAWGQVAMTVMLDRLSDGSPVVMEGDEPSRMAAQVTAVLRTTNGDLVRGR